MTTNPRLRRDCGGTGHENLDANDRSEAKGRSDVDGRSEAKGRSGVDGRSDVAVIGAGVGGLAVAIRLASNGHTVTVFERNDIVGGKLATYRRDGYVFDIGPSLLTLPHVFDEVFRAAGTSLDEQVELVRLDPQFHYHWPDGSSLIVHDDNERTAVAFEKFRVGSGDAWRSFDARGRRIWDVAERTFFAGAMSNPMSLLRRIRSPFDLTAIDPLRTLHRSASTTFRDWRLVQWADRYATYSGSSPYRAPATLACIPHIEARFGCWYPMGGLDALRQALQRVAVDVGVDIRTGSEVARVTTRLHRVTGVELTDGTRHDMTIVVANTDAEHLYLDLLDHTPTLRRIRTTKRSTSGFVVCAGVRGSTPGIGHHNVWFSDDYRAEFDAIDRGELDRRPDDLRLRVVGDRRVTSSRRVRELVPARRTRRPGVDVDADHYQDLILRRLAEHGVTISDRIEFTHTMTPSDIAERYRSPGGAIYGASSDGKRAAFVRPANRGACAGLYLVGGSSHPGGGLPLVASSARIVADMIDEDRVR